MPDGCRHCRAAATVAAPAKVEPSSSGGGRITHSLNTTTLWEGGLTPIPLLLLSILYLHTEFAGCSRCERRSDSGLRVLLQFVLQIAHIRDRLDEGGEVISSRLLHTGVCVRRSVDACVSTVALWFKAPRASSDPHPNPDRTYARGHRTCLMWTNAPPGCTGTFVKRNRKSVRALTVHVCGLRVASVPFEAHTNSTSF